MGKEEIAFRGRCAVLIDARWILARLCVLALERFIGRQTGPESTERTFIRDQGDTAENRIART